MSFSDRFLAENYSALGFTPNDLGMELNIGRVEMKAVEHPLKGVVVFFTALTSRTATQYESGIPATLSAKRVAQFIYVNFAKNFYEDAELCQRHFEARGIRLFQ